MNNFEHSISIFTGIIPPSKELFLKLENAFLIADKNQIIEIVSLKPNIEIELMGWARLKGHLYLGRKNLKNQYSYKIQKISNNDFNEKASWGKTMKGIDTSNPKLKDINLTDEILLKAPDNNGLFTRGIIPQEGTPFYDLEKENKLILSAVDIFEGTIRYFIYTNNPQESVYDCVAFLKSSSLYKCDFEITLNDSGNWIKELLF